MKPEAVKMKLVGMEAVKRKYAELEAELGCKDLSWYLENVDHEMAWEKDRLCHPWYQAPHRLACKGKLLQGRFTVTEEMPRADYLAARGRVTLSKHVEKHGTGILDQSEL